MRYFNNILMIFLLSSALLALPLAAKDWTEGEKMSKGEISGKSNQVAHQGATMIAKKLGITKKFGIRKRFVRWSSKLIKKGTESGMGNANGLIGDFHKDVANLAATAGSDFLPGDLDGAKFASDIGGFGSAAGGAGSGGGGGDYGGFGDYAKYADSAKDYKKAFDGLSKGFEKFKAGDYAGAFEGAIGGIDAGSLGEYGETFTKGKDFYDTGSDGLKDFNKTKKQFDSGDYLGAAGTAFGAVDSDDLGKYGESFTKGKDAFEKGSDGYKDLSKTQKQFAKGDYLGAAGTAFGAVDSDDLGKYSNSFTKGKDAFEKGSDGFNDFSDTKDQFDRGDFFGAAGTAFGAVDSNDMGKFGDNFDRTKDGFETFAGAGESVSDGDFLGAAAETFGGLQDGDFAGFGEPRSPATVATNQPSGNSKITYNDGFYAKQDGTPARRADGQLLGNYNSPYDYKAPDSQGYADVKFGGVETGQRIKFADGAAKEQSTSSGAPKVTFKDGYYAVPDGSPARKANGQLIGQYESHLNHGDLEASKRGSSDTSAKRNPPKVTFEDGFYRTPDKSTVKRFDGTTVGSYDGLFR